MATTTSQTTTLRALEQLGLGENEAALYIIMLKYPEATVQELQKRSPFPRTMLYYVLGHLEQFGLVSTIKKPRRTVYIAEDPEKLYDLLAVRQREFEKNKTLAETTIPELRNQFRLAHERPGVRILEGVSGYREALEQIIEAKPERVFSYWYEDGKRKAGLEIRDEFAERLPAEKIHEDVLLADSPEARAWAKRHAYDQMRAIRLAPKKLSPFAIDLKIYESTVLHTSYEGREPVVLKTEDARLAQLQRSLFINVWQQSQDIKNI